MNVEFKDIVARLAGRVSSPRLEARMILSALLESDERELPPAGLSLSPEQSRRLETILSLRLQHWPLDKLLGRKDFYKYRFVVNEDVLSPRPDTEILVEQAAGLLQKDTSARMILDLGTGSGCILLSLLADFPNICGCGVDISSRALAVAAQNAAALGVSARVNFFQLDWFAPDFVTKLGRRFPLIVSNPPYIPSKEIASLDEEVRAHDPIKALDGGAGGYDSYQKLAELAPALLENGGYILLESGAGQDERIAALFTARGLIHIKTVPDLAGIPRCVILQKTEEK